jgi:hypothetical protein
MMPFHVVIWKSFITFVTLEWFVLEVHSLHMSVLILFLCEHLITLITMQFHLVRDLDKDIVVIQDERFVSNALHGPYNTTERKFSVDINESIIKVGWDDLKYLITIGTAQVSGMVILMMVVVELNRIQRFNWASSAVETRAA